MSNPPKNPSNQDTPSSVQPTPLLTYGMGALNSGAVNPDGTITDSNLQRRLSYSSELDHANSERDRQAAEIAELKAMVRTLAENQAKAQMPPPPQKTNSGKRPRTHHKRTPTENPPFPTPSSQPMRRSAFKRLMYDYVRDHPQPSESRGTSQTDSSGSYASSHPSRDRRTDAEPSRRRSVFDGNRLSHGNRDDMQNNQPEVNSGNRNAEPFHATEGPSQPAKPKPQTYVWEDPTTGQKKILREIETTDDIPEMQPIPGPSPQAIPNPEPQTKKLKKRKQIQATLQPEPQILITTSPKAPNSTLTKAQEELLSEEAKTSPFTLSILQEGPPPHFTFPKLKVYELGQNAVTHASQFRRMMNIYGYSDAMKCKIFPLSLSPAIMTWYSGLRPGTISCFAELEREFTARYVTSIDQPQTLDTLLSLKRNPGESLRTYVDRYWGVYNMVEDYDEKHAAASFKNGLDDSSLLFRDLSVKPPKSMKELMDAVERECRHEEHIAARRAPKVTTSSPKNSSDPSPKKQVNNVRNRNQNNPKTAPNPSPVPQIPQIAQTPHVAPQIPQITYPVDHAPLGQRIPRKEYRVHEHTAETTVFTEPIWRLLRHIKNLPTFYWPTQPLGTADGSVANPTIKCSYHNEQGHYTTSCRPYKRLLEELAAGGHLNEWIDQPRTNLPPPPAIHQRQVNVIQRMPSAEMVAAYRGTDSSVLPRAVCNIEGTQRKRPSPSGGWQITFDEDDLEGLQAPHFDALVVSLSVADAKVSRVLVDSGSSADIMFQSTFKQLGLDPATLRPTETALVGFAGRPVYPLGMTTLPVRTGSRVVNVEFLVVQSPSPYNLILGRTWLHTLKAVASTYHQVVKYVGWNGRQESLRGDQPQARKCAVSTVIQGKSHMDIQCVETADAPVLEDVGVSAEARSVEELVKMPINDDASRYFLLGSTLTAAERNDLFQFLKDNIEVFAWTPYEMPGVDPSFACHELNVNPARKPVVQKARRAAFAHVEAVNEEVEKLLEAGAIREVQYPSWLANPVVVPKKNGKLRVCVDYTNLNDACPMDRFPLPRIDQLVDATTGYARLSFMDAYRGYHQIALAEKDQEKTAFISPRGIFCYKVMPFGLKNAGATYQRMVSRMFSDQIGKTMEAYIDDMVVKTKLADNHIRDLADVFARMKQFGLRLNAEKCAFGVSSGKFLGYLVTQRGIQADPKQIDAIQNLQAPKSIKEVQKLTGMVAALNRFISKSGVVCRPFFQAIKSKRGKDDPTSSQRLRGEKFQWTEECDASLRHLKDYLTRAPLLAIPEAEEDLYLYLSVSSHAVSSVLVRREGFEHQPIYYSSKTMADAHTRYLPMEKLALALISAKTSLLPYFQSHRIIVLTDHPIKAALRKTDSSKRMLKWALELANYDIQFEPRTSIKGQALADFIAELTPALENEVQTLAEVEQAATAARNQEIEIPEATERRVILGNKKPIRSCQIYSGDSWQLNVDGASNANGAGAGIVLVSPQGTVHESALTLGFDASNNEAEYEALIAGLRLANHMGADAIQVFCDSQLVVGQMNKEFQTKDERMSNYVQVVNELCNKFGNVDFQWVERGKNSHADALASLASAYKAAGTRSIELGEIARPSWEISKNIAMILTLGHGKLDPVLSYLRGGPLPPKKKDAQALLYRAANYYLINDDLYKRSSKGPDLKVLRGDQTQHVLEELHSGTCGAHAGGRSLAHRAITQGYWWPHMMKDAENFARRCDSCQKHANLIHQPANPLKMIDSPWPFAIWGLDLVGKLPKAPGGFEYLITATDLFTKWAEAEPLAKIAAEDVEKFIWKNIISRFGIPYAILSDNGTQFVADAIQQLCAKHKITIHNSSVSYPQGNGQAEATNKIVAAGLKRRLDKKLGKWVEELPKVLWAYRTTPRRSTGRTPFALAYGMEAVLPLGLQIPTIRTEHFDDLENEESISVALSLAEELRDEAHIQHAAYQQEVAKGYNQNVRARPFNVGDLVLRQVVEKSKLTKLRPHLEGPFKIAAKAGHGVYKLANLDGSPIPNTWNAQRLQKYHG